jgi:DNA-binding response OmpR family regulator
MRRILVVDDDPHICLAICAWLKRYGSRVSISGYAFSGPDFMRMAVRLGATRCLRKPFRPTTLLSVIDECLSEAEPRRRYFATLAAIADAVSEPRGKIESRNQSRGEAVSL